MPTAYTHYIEDGSIKTPQEFLTLCLNAFGIGTLDFGIKYKPDLTEDIKARFQQQIDYHQQRIDAEKKKMIWYQSLTDDELYHRFKTDLDSRRKYLKSARRKILQSADRYQQFTDAIKNWNCSEEFTRLKMFALGQIEVGATDNL